MLWILLTTALAAPPAAGAWVLEESASTVEARVQAAVDKAAAEFGLFKSIARPRIAKGATWCRRYEMDLTADPLRWRCDDKQPLETPASQLGKPRTLTFPQGEIATTIQWVGDTLQARFGGEDGARVNVFRFSEDRMVVDIRIESSRLSEPVRWSIPYVRAPQ